MGRKGANILSFISSHLVRLRPILVQVNSTAAFKFVISSVPLTGMWGGPNGQIDTWMGASQERLAFLELLEYVPNVVVISGDRHEFAAVEHLGANTIHEFSIRYVKHNLG